MRMAFPWRNDSPTLIEPEGSSHKENKSGDTLRLSSLSYITFPLAPTPDFTLPTLWNPGRNPLKFLIYSSMKLVVMTCDIACIAIVVRAVKNSTCGSITPVCLPFDYQVLASAIAPS